MSASPASRSLTPFRREVADGTSAPRTREGALAHGIGVAHRNAASDATRDCKRKCSFVRTRRHPRCRSTTVANSTGLFGGWSSGRDSRTAVRWCCTHPVARHSSRRGVWASQEAQRLRAICSPRGSGCRERRDARRTSWLVDAAGGRRKEKAMVAALLPNSQAIRGPFPCYYPPCVTRTVCDATHRAGVKSSGLIAGAGRRPSVILPVTRWLPRWRYAAGSTLDGPRLHTD